VDYDSISRTGGVSLYAESEKTKNSSLGYEEEERRERERERQYGTTINNTFNINGADMTAADLMEEAKYREEEAVIRDVPG
jgi:hypothetical protein